VTGEEKVNTWNVDTNGRRESQHVDTKGGNNNFIINCENQDSNSERIYPPSDRSRRWGEDRKDASH
jgi:hypothetical protein